MLNNKRPADFINLFSPNNFNLNTFNNLKIEWNEKYWLVANKKDANEFFEKLNEKIYFITCNNYRKFRTLKYTFSVKHWFFLLFSNKYDRRMYSQGFRLREIDEIRYCILEEMKHDD